MSPRLPARYSLGLCSPSRFSLQPRCPFLWTPRPGTAPSKASFTLRCRLADHVPKHIAYRGLIRTGLSLTFQLRFTDADGILRIETLSSRDLPAVEVALFPLALRIASPKLNAAISPSSRRLSTEAPIQDLPGRIKPAAPCLPTHRSVPTDLPEHRSAPAQMPRGYILLLHAEARWTRTQPLQNCRPSWGL